MPPSGGIRGTAAGKVNTGASSLPSEGIGSMNLGSAAGKGSSSYTTPPAGATQSGTVFTDNRGPQPAGKGK